MAEWTNKSRMAPQPPNFNGGGFSWYPPNPAIPPNPHNPPNMVKPNPQPPNIGINHEWRVQNKIDYNRESISSFTLKVRDELTLIYSLLNRLRKMDASAGRLADTVAYQLHVDTASGRLLMRDAKNENWIELGKLGENFFGITPEDIGAVKNSGTVGSLYAGDVADLPKNAGIHDIFYALDEKKIYFNTGTSWELLASLDFADLYGLKQFSLAGLSSFVTAAGLSATLGDYVKSSALSAFVTESSLSTTLADYVQSSGFSIASDDDISALFNVGGLSNA